MDGGAAHGLGPFEPYWTETIGPPRRHPAWRRRLGLSVAAAAAMIAAAALSPSRQAAEVGGRTVALGSPPPAMSQPTFAAPALALEGVGGDAVGHETGLDRIAVGRGEALTVGRLDGDGPALRAEIWLEGRRSAVSLFVAAAETAAASGAAVERIGPRQTLASASGPFEWAPVGLAVGGRACAAFRLASNAGGLRGVVCARSGAEIDEASLACLIERFSLTKAGREAGFGEVLKPSPSRRGGCRTPLG